MSITLDVGMREKIIGYGTDMKNSSRYFKITYDIYNAISSMYNNKKLSESELVNSNKINHVLISKQDTIYNSVIKLNNIIENNMKNNSFVNNYINYNTKYGDYLSSLEMYNITMKKFDKNGVIKLFKMLYTDNSVFGIIMHINGNYINPISIQGIKEVIKIIKSKDDHNIKITLYKRPKTFSNKSKIKNIVDELYKKIKNDIFSEYVEPVYNNESMADVFYKIINDLDINFNNNKNMTTEEIVRRASVYYDERYIRIHPYDGSRGDNLSFYRKFNSIINKYDNFLVETPYTGYRGVLYPAYGFHCFKNDSTQNTTSISNFSYGILSGFLPNLHPNINTRTVPNWYSKGIDDRGASICVGKESFSHLTSIYTITHKNLDSPYVKYINLPFEIFNFMLTLRICIDIFMSELP